MNMVHLKMDPWKRRFLLGREIFEFRLLHHSGNICVYLFCNQLEEESQMFQVRTSKLFMFWGFESHINEATSDFFSWTGSGSIFWIRPQLFLSLKRVALQENLEENVNIYSPVSVRGPAFLPKTLGKMNPFLIFCSKRMCGRNTR